MANHNYQKNVKRLGIPDEFIHHGSQQELHHDCKYDANAIITTVRQVMKKNLLSQAAG